MATTKNKRGIQLLGLIALIAIVTAFAIWLWLEANKASQIQPVVLGPCEQAVIALAANPDDAEIERAETS